MEIKQERINSWSNAEEMIVAEAVLRQMRDDSNLKEVFEELAYKLNRTVSSIKNRWYTKISLKYEEAIKIAKSSNSGEHEKVNNTEAEETEFEQGSLFGKRVLERKEKANQEVKHTPTISEAINEYNKEILTDALNIDNIIHFLTQNKDIFNSKDELEQLRKENELLRLENTKVKKEKSELEIENGQIKEDYKVLADVINTARNLVQVDYSPTVYKTDKNGNVEIKK